MKQAPEAYFLPYQIEWLNDKSAIKVWEKSRRIGATYVQSYEDVEDCLNKRVPSVWFSSADDTAAREYILYCEQWATLFDLAIKQTGQGEVLEDNNAVKTHWINFANGTKITALTSSPKKFRSKGGKVVWDEAAWHEDQIKMWAALKPVATWGYPLRILSTHNGASSLFNQFIKQILAGVLKWSLHRTDIFTAVTQGLVDKIYNRKTTEKERQEWLETERRNCVNADIWAQEYCCTPIDETTAFLPYELIGQCEKEAGDIIRDLETLKGDLYLGMDVGRKRHLSVIWIVEKLGYQCITRKVPRFENTPFQIQQDALHKFLSLRNMRRACIDSTGIGMQLAENAVKFAGTNRLELVTFTAKVKEDLAYGLRNSMEDRLVIIPSEEQIRTDLHSTRKIVTSSGNIRFDVAATENPDAHADHFWALALALHAAKENAGPVSVITRKPKNRTFTQYYIKEKLATLLKGFK